MAQAFVGTSLYGGINRRTYIRRYIINRKMKGDYVRSTGPVSLVRTAGGDAVAETYSVFTLLRIISSNSAGRIPDPSQEQTCN